VEKRFQACTAATPDDGANEWFGTFPEALRWISDRVTATHPHYIEVWVNYRTPHGETVEILQSDTSWFAPDVPKETHLVRHRNDEAAPNA
jgi:hypothetical protein